MGVARGRRGSVMVEFAIGSSLLILLFSGTFRFGYTLFAYDGLVSAVRSGARFGSMAVYHEAVPTSGSAPFSQFVAEVQNITVYGNREGTGTPVVTGLRPEHVSVTVGFANNMPSQVTVAISGYELDGVFGNWRAQGQPTATFPYMGRYDPPMPSTL